MAKSILSIEEYYGKPLGLLAPQPSGVGDKSRTVDLHVRVSTREQFRRGNHLAQAWEAYYEVCMHGLEVRNVIYEVGPATIPMSKRPQCLASLTTSRDSGVPVVFVNLKRVIRGPGFKRIEKKDIVDPEEWQDLQDFGATVLLVLPLDTPPEEIKSRETIAGMRMKGKKGGRPKVDYTERDQLILERLEKGESYRAIGRALGIDHKTVGRRATLLGTPASWWRGGA